MASSSPPIVSMEPFTGHTWYTHAHTHKTEEFKCWTQTSVQQSLDISPACVWPACWWLSCNQKLTYLIAEAANFLKSFCFLRQIFWETCLVAITSAYFKKVSKKNKTKTNQICIHCSTLPTHIWHEWFMIPCIKHKIHIHLCLTGSWRGVQLHFLRRLSLFLIGHCWSAPASMLPPPISKARAAANVARLWRSKVSMSSPAQRRIASI